jgi:hypothetical protein
MQRSRSSSHQLPTQALFLRRLPSSAASLTDLQQWASNATKLNELVCRASPGNVQQLAISSELPTLLCSSLGHSLQLLAAAPGTTAADTALAVLLSLAHSTSVLLTFRGERPTSRDKQCNTRMAACVESSGQYSGFAYRSAGNCTATLHAGMIYQTELAPLCGTCGLIT